MNYLISDKNIKSYNKKGNSMRTLKKPAHQESLKFLKILEKNISYFCEIYASNAPKLTEVNPQDLLIHAADYILLAETKEELAFFTFAVSSMLSRIKDASFDGLELRQTITSLSKAADKYETGKQNFIPFRADGLEIIDNFIKHSQKFIKSLSDEKSDSQSKEKIKSLLKYAKKIKLILQDTPETEIIAKIRESLIKFELIFEKREGHSQQTLAINSCRSVLMNLFFSRYDSLESVHSNPIDATGLVAFGLSFTGPLSELHRALETSIASADLIISLLATGKDISDSGIKNNLINIGVTASTVISLLCVMITVPAAIPIILTAIGMLDLAREDIRFIRLFYQGLKLESRSLKRLDVIFKLVETLHAGIKADLYERLETTVDMQLLYSRIVEEKSLSKRKIYGEEISRFKAKQTKQVVSHLIYGRSYDLSLSALREIKLLGANLEKQSGLDSVAFATKLVEKNQSSSQSVIIAPVLAALCHEYSGQGKVAGLLFEILNHPYDERGKKLQEILGNKFTSEQLDNFTKIISSCLVAGKTFTASFQASLN